MDREGREQTARAIGRKRCSNGELTGRSNENLMLDMRICVVKHSEAHEEETAEWRRAMIRHYE